MKKAIAVILSAMFVLSLAACSGSKSQPTTSSTAAKKQKVIGISLFYRRDEFYKDLESGMDDEAAKLGYKLIIQDADTDPTKQTAQLEDFIAKKVDAIALSATDPTGMIPAVQEATQAGIPVFTFDGSTKDNQGVTSYIGMDNLAAGEQAGQWAKDYINKNLGGKANVVILEYPQSAVVCGARVTGFLNVIQSMPGVKVVAKQDGKASRTDSMTVMENIIQANKKIDLVFGINDDTVFGAIAALQAANMKNVAVVDVGWSEELFQKLQNKDSYMQASAVQNPYNMAVTAIDVIGQYFNTKSVPKENLAKSVLYTADNISGLDWKSIVAKRKS